MVAATLHQVRSSAVCGVVRLLVLLHMMVLGAAPCRWCQKPCQRAVAPLTRGRHVALPIFRPDVQPATLFFLLTVHPFDGTPQLHQTRKYHSQTLLFMPAAFALPPCVQPETAWLKLHFALAPLVYAMAGPLDCPSQQPESMLWRYSSVRQWE